MQLGKDRSSKETREACLGGSEKAGLEGMETQSHNLREEAQRGILGNGGKGS